MELLYAADYELHGKRHAGKAHAIKEGERTYCGTEFRYTGGRIATGERESVSCKGCIRSLDARDSWAQQQEEWQQRSAELARQRQDENDQWWAWYSEYLQSPDWARRRSRVLTRASGLCEGCRENPAAHVHHTTYAHVGNELLFELVALCHSCHQIAHPDKAI